MLKNKKQINNKKKILDKIKEKKKKKFLPQLSNNLEKKQNTMTNKVK